MDALRRLPHAPPFLFLSELRWLHEGRDGCGVWRITGEEDFFRGHFPSRPIVPGVLIAEALAQLSGLVGAGSGESRLAHVDVRFKTPVVPPAEVELRSTLARELGGLTMFQVSAVLGEVEIARGLLTLSGTPEVSA